jgi:hypothetical protein
MGPWFIGENVKPGRLFAKCFGEKVINKTGATLTQGTIVYPSGWDVTAQCFKVTKANAGTVGAKAAFIITETVTDGNTTQAVKAFRLEKVNTLGAAVGDPVYESGTSGGWTLTDPSVADTSKRSNIIGRVEVVSATVGVIQIDMWTHVSHVLGGGDLKAGILAATVAGRALMATGYFSAAKVLDAFAAGSFDATACASVFANGAIPVNKLDPTGLQYTTVDLTAAQIKALRATPATLVAAPGASKVLEFVSAELSYDYGGTAFTITAGADDLAVKLKDGTGPQVSQTLETTGFVDQAADMVYLLRSQSATFVAATYVNQPMVLHNIGANELTLGNGTFHVHVAYRVHPTGL